MSSSEGELDPRQVRGTRTNMKSLFAQDENQGRDGSQSLRYEGQKRKEEGSAASASSVACQATVVCYRGDQHVGTLMAVVTTSQQGTFLILVDRQRKPQSRVRIDAQLQFLQNQSELQYATVYDPHIQAHWSLMFRSPDECTNFTVAVLTVQHYTLIADGPVETFTELVANQQDAVARKGDICTMSIAVWLLQRVGQSVAFTIGKKVEEIPRAAPRRIKVGDGAMMVGVEEALQAMTAGSKRIVFLPQRKTKCKGLGNPEIGPSDSVVALVEVVEVEQVEELPTFEKEEASKRRGGKKQAADPFDTYSPEPTRVRESPVSNEVKSNTASPQMASPMNDTNTLLQAMLMQQLQAANQPKPASTTPDSTANISVERSLDRLHQQISSLYEKIDRIDIQHKLEKNNEKIERMVKKAVGKMPVSDVDIEDMNKDRDALLAKIEHQKQRMEELTDSYHKALETLGKHKEEKGALKSDLAIQRDANEKQFKELSERKRLEIVDMEVRHRREMDRTKEEQFQLGKEAGYKSGYEAGKIDAIQIAGSSSTDELKRMLSAKERDIVDLHSQLADKDAKQIEERRQHDDAIQSLNNLLTRFEERDIMKTKETVDVGASIGKTIRRIMNQTYSAIEAQLYATEKADIPVEEALQLVLITIKSESRQAIEEAKREATVKSTAPVFTSSSTDESKPTDVPPPMPPSTYSFQPEMEAPTHVAPVIALQPSAESIPGPTNVEPTRIDYETFLKESQTNSNETVTLPPPPPLTSNQHQHSFEEMPGGEIDASELPPPPTDFWDSAPTDGNAWPAPPPMPEVEERRQEEEEETSEVRRHKEKKHRHPVEEEEQPYEEPVQEPEPEEEEVKPMKTKRPAAPKPGMYDSSDSDEGFD